jgi:hypothetical protein
MTLRLPDDFPRLLATLDEAVAQQDWDTCKREVDTLNSTDRAACCVLMARFPHPQMEQLVFDRACCQFVSASPLHFLIDASVKAAQQDDTATIARMSQFAQRTERSLHPARTVYLEVISELIRHHPSASVLPWVMQQLPVTTLMSSFHRKVKGGELSIDQWEQACLILAKENLLKRRQTMHAYLDKLAPAQRPAFPRLKAFKLAEARAWEATRAATEASPCRVRRRT